MREDEFYFNLNEAAPKPALHRLLEGLRKALIQLIIIIIIVSSSSSSSSSFPSLTATANIAGS